MRPVLSVLTAAAIALAACGGGASSGASNAAAATAIAGSTTAKASANNATAAQLQAAFEAGGVPNASRWVIEVQEYRPYPVDDPTFAKLKSNLAKYNPSADTLSRILASLSLP
jgi:ABC-type glycerol-3-phosphate transport system substrate-binding protein